MGPRGAADAVADRHAELRQGFKLQREAFIRHVAEGAPYRWDRREGAKGV